MTPEVLAFASACLFALSLVGLLAIRVLRGGGGIKPAARVGDLRDGDGGGIGAGAGTGVKPKDKESEVKLKLALYYGTQTGTSERFAREVEEEIKQRYGGAVVVRTSDLEHITADTAEEELTCKSHEPLAVFLQSTYGDGEPTDTSMEFVHWLRDLADDGRMPDLLGNLTYAVFGLGNSSYEQYNAAAKMVDTSMHALGAKQLLKIHLGDDDCTLEEDFQGWREVLWAAMETQYGISAGEDGALGAADAPTYNVAAASGAQAADAELRTCAAMSDRPAAGVTTQSRPYAAPVLAARELQAPTSGRSCVHLTFDLAGTGITYQHGDHLGVFAENAPPVVHRAAACLGLSMQHAFALSVPADAPASLAQPFPSPCTLATALAKYADLLSPPRKSALAALASVATDPAEKSKLSHLASAAGKAEYAAYIADPGRSLLEVLEGFPSAVPPLGLFFGAVCARLAPRYYSISSSPLDNPDVVTATVAVVKGETPTGRMHQGVASTYMARFVPRRQDGSGGEHDGQSDVGADDDGGGEMAGVRVPVFVRASTFKLPRNPAVPVVMIGPGTGYAPFRGFLQERAARAKAGELLGPAHLFFGCRREDEDFIYRDEMEAALVTEPAHLSTLHVAFSRADAGRKVYVQDKLMAASKDVYAIMKGSVGANQGRIYVCGDAKGMARDVHRALHSILMTEGGYAGHEAEEIVKRLSDSGRYHKDVW